MRSNIPFLLATSCVLAACASTSGSSASTEATPVVMSANGTKIDPKNLITAAQIEKANVPTAFEAVDRLHRQWFRDLYSGGSGEVTVYLNNQKLDGGKEALRQIPAHEVLTLEYLKSTDAVMRFGQDAKGGAIIVTRK